MLELVDLLQAGEVAEWSKATQTFILQRSGFGSYLPTERAQAGGHYSAVPQSNVIGPKGGQMLVDKTVEIIDGLWK